MKNEYVRPAPFVCILFGFIIGNTVQLAAHAFAARLLAYFPRNQRFLKVILHKFSLKYVSIPAFKQLLWGLASVPSLWAIATDVHVVEFIQSDEKSDGAIARQ